MKRKTNQFISFILIFVLMFLGCASSSTTTLAGMKKTSAPTKIVLNAKQETTAVGCSLTLKVQSVTPANASKKVTWSSSNSKIATVSKKGVVKAKKTGTVTITARSTTNKKAVAKCKIKVYKATKKMKLVSEKSYTLEQGKSVTLKAKVTSPAKGYEPVKWSTKDAKVAKVSKGGKVTAVSAGTTTVIGQSGKKTVRVTITVKEKQQEQTPDTPNSDNGAQDTPQPDKPAQDDPTPDNPTPDNPTPDNPTPDNPTPDNPTPDNPTPDNPTPDEPTPDDPTAYTRAEWVSMLAEKLGYTIDKENMYHDEETGEVLYSYDDIAGEEKADQIEAALVGGVLPAIDSEDSNSRLFEPDEIVTRDYAAMTAVHAMGYALGEDIACVDSADVTYVKEAAIAVDIGLLDLIDGAFCPDTVLTEEEGAQIFSVIDEWIVGKTIDENHEDVVTFRSDVLNGFDAQIVYTLSESIGENGEKLLTAVLPYSETSLELLYGENANAETVSANEIPVGQVLLLPSTDEYLGGVALKIQQIVINEEEQQILVTGTAPENISDIVEEIDLEGRTDTLAGDIIWGQDVTEITDSATASGDDILSADKESAVIGIDKKVSVSLGNNAQAEVQLKVPKIDYIVEYKALPAAVDRIYVKVPNTINVSVKGSVEKSGSKEICKLPYKVAGGVVTIQIGVYLNYSLNGEVSIAYNIDDNFGIDYRNKKLSTFKNISVQKEISAEVTGKLGMSLGVDLLVVGCEIYNVRGEIGVGLKASVAKRPTAMLCTDLKIYAYLDLYIGEETDDGDCLLVELADIILGSNKNPLKQTFDLVNENNSPLKAGIHIEDGSLVPACTYGQTVGNGRVKVTVTDTDTKKAIGNCAIAITQNGVTKKSVATNAGGVAEITGLTPGTYMLRVGTGSYQSVEEKIIVKSSLTNTITVSLKKSSGGTSGGNSDDSSGSSSGGSSGGNTGDSSNESSFSSSIPEDWGTIDDSASFEEIPSGTYKGMNWKIDAEGNLTISGAYTEEEKDSLPPWLQYQYLIKSAEVTATGVKNTASWFAGCTCLEKIVVGELSTEDVTDMSSMFENCKSLTSLELTNFDTFLANNMSNMFRGCSALTVIKVGAAWNTEYTKTDDMFTDCGVSEVTYVEDPVTVAHSGVYYGMDWSIYTNGFLRITGEYSGNNSGEIWSHYSSEIKRGMVNATGVKSTENWFRGCSKLSSLDVSGFDTSNVRNMGYMFYECNDLSNLDVSGFDTSNVRNMGYMFRGCSKLSNLDVSNFDTSSVTDMGVMFGSCSKLSSLDVSSFDTSSVTDMRSMFYSCSNLSSLDVSRFDTSSVTNMSSMFKGCSKLSNLDVSRFDTSSVTNMDSMFRGCSKLSSLDVSRFDTRSVACMSGMFGECYQLSSLDVSNFDTSSVTSMSDMFYSCINLSSLDVSSFDTSSVRRMDGMFGGCNNLSSLDVSSFDTSNVTDMRYMFKDCESLSSLDVSGFDTSSVTSMSSMFYGCNKLSSLDVSNFDTSSVKYMFGMFWGCSSLSSLDLSSFDTSSVTDMTDMFRDCSNLNTINVPLKVKEDCALPATFNDASGNEYTYLPQEVTESFVITRVSE